MEHPPIRGLSEWQPLARGGLAVVWRARQLALDRLVAVKVYQRALDDAPASRFVCEAAAAGRVSDHPGIVTAYDAGILPDDRPYLVMELCPGGSLTRWLKPDRRPAEEQVREAGVRMADALAAVHAAGVLHRDVKPANILIDSYGHPRLADFGLAVVAGVEPAATQALGVTPAYAPPEVFRRQPAAESGDVFSLAATLYAVLVGRPPRPAVSMPATCEQLDQVLSTPIEPVAEVNWFLMDVLLTALDDDPQARPSAAELRDQLAELAVPRASGRGPRIGAGTAPISVLTRGRSPGRDQAAALNNRTAAGAGANEATQTRRDPAPAPASRSRRKRRLATLAVSAALVAVLAPVTAWLVGQPASSSAPAVVSQTASSELPSPSVGTSPGFATRSTSSNGSDAGNDTGAGAIALKASANSAKPFETIRIEGTYRGRPGTFLRVQWRDNGRWVDFPLPTRTDESGRFTAYAELGQPGRHQLRLVDPDSGVKSEPIVVAIKS